MFLPSIQPNAERPSEPQLPTDMSPRGTRPPHERSEGGTRWEEGAEMLERMGLPATCWWAGS